MPLLSALHFEELGSLMNITRIWYHSARSLANCLLLPPIRCLGHHSQRRQRSTSSSSKRCDKLVVVAAQIDPTRFFQRPPCMRYTQRGGKSYTLQRRGSHPYYRGGARGRGARVSQRTKSQ